MPRKKKAPEAKDEPATKRTMSTTNEHVPATELMEPPKDETQPKSGDLKHETGPTGKDDATTNNAEDVPANGDGNLTTSGEGEPALKPSQAPRKRKNQSEHNGPSKASRRSGRGAKQPSQLQLLQFLLSSKAEELLRPEDEQKDIQERGDIRTYSSSVLNPFEELMSAIILSRPISHRLGLRSIRTVLNTPYNFSSATAVQKAGEEQRHQALWDAKTQHKAKTAEQLGELADVVLEQYTSDDDGISLDKALSDNDNDLDKTLDSLKKNIKGLGNTGIEIFLRRVQWMSPWDAAYPYADGRSRDGLRKLGLMTQDAEELQHAIAEHWGKLETKHLAGDDEAARKRRAFVVVLEGATGADLENMIDEVQAAAVDAHK